MFLPVRQQSNASTSITMPSRSQSSISSGAGGLCEVRRALTPMLFMMVSWRSTASALTAAPSAPRSWWRSTPWSLAYRPFRENPRSGSKAAWRSPQGVRYRSTVSWPTRSSVSRA
ncbi:hypothetical protein Z951_31500 [Streptomyces sp. PRh5]|nr:hypothetical protein Z951_31500 [Streptomyces sp. PRh5]